MNKTVVRTGALALLALLSVGSAQANWLSAHLRQDGRHADERVREDGRDMDRDTRHAAASTDQHATQDARDVSRDARADGRSIARRADQDGRHLWTYRHGLDHDGLAR